jgi:glutathione S-transferase
MLKLYFKPGSSSMAPHIALNEIGCPFEVKYLSPLKKEQQTPEYLAINAEGKVPTLMIDGEPLTEVLAILVYLARRFPAANLLPVGDLEAEAHVLSWMSFLASTVHPARRSGPEAAAKAWQLVEARLGGRTWAVGDGYTVADIHLFRLYWRYINFPPPVIGTYPGLDAHYQRVMARPAVRKTCEIESAIGYHLPV